MGARVPHSLTVIYWKEAKLHNGVLLGSRAGGWGSGALPPLFPFLPAPYRSHVGVADQGLGPLLTPGGLCPFIVGDLVGPPTGPSSAFLF